MIRGVLVCNPWSANGEVSDRQLRARHMYDFANFGEGIPSFALSGAVGTLKEARCGRRRRFSDLGREVMMN